MPNTNIAIVPLVEPIIANTVEAQGVELYNLEYLTEYGRKILRLYIDKEGGITLDDCERVSRAVEPVLDAHDPIPEAYVLEVSSPGIERKLVKDSHFASNIGKTVEVKLFKPLDTDRRKKFSGVLSEFNNGTVTVATSQGDFKLKRDDIAQCRLVFKEL